jgi:4-amino-4-deoxy-L-arabinose transferase-like glycosyltransferase
VDSEAARRFARQYSQQPRRVAEASSRRTIRDCHVALLLALLTLILLLLTAPRIGLTWDEPAYIAASEAYVEWLGRLLSDPSGALSPEGIRYGWEPNHEHPPVNKVYSGLVWVVARPVFDDLLAHRLGNMLLASALVGMLYLLVAPRYRRVAGIAGCAALLTMPRFFFHAHLAALDLPATVAMVAVTLLFWHTHEHRGWRYGILLGLLWGLALATKFNTVLVPPLLGLWALIFRRRLYLFGRLTLAVVIGLPLSLVIWPWLYHDFWERLIEYLRFLTVDHHQIGQWYLGEYFLPPPWHFPFVMAFAVVPTTVTVLLLAGLVRVIISRHNAALGWLLILSALPPMLLLTTGQSVVYDNERLFLPSFPFLAALAGVGFAALLGGLQKIAGRAVPRLPGVAWTGALAAIFFLPQTVSAAFLYPHLLSYYSANVGGLPGAARLGLEHTYWCETYAAALEYLNREAEPGAIIWVEDWSFDVMLYYQLQGLLRPDLRITAPPGAVSVLARSGVRPAMANMGAADYALVQYRQTGFITNPAIGGLLGTRQPVLAIVHRGVSIMELYER